MPFNIGDNKIIWPKDQYEAIKSEFGNGIDKFDNDLFEIATRANVFRGMDITGDSPSFNEVLAGELGIDLVDVEEVINNFVDDNEIWESFKEYKELRRNTKLTFEKFVELFHIISE